MKSDSARAMDLLSRSLPPVEQGWGVRLHPLKPDRMLQVVNMIDRWMFDVPIYLLVTRENFAPLIANLILEQYEVHRQEQFLRMTR